MKHSVMISLFILAGVLMISGCKSKKYTEIDLSSTHTTAATAAPTVKETLAPTTAAVTTEETKASLTTSIETHISEGSDKLSIQYPVLFGMSDDTRQEAVNKLLKTNAISIEPHFQRLNSNVTANVKCEVTSVDRKRLTAVYTGSYTTTGGAYPVNFFYTNTVDLSEVKNLGLDDYSDAYTMAGYVMSDDCEFYQASGELRQALLDYRATQSLEIYTDLFSSADFPSEADSDAVPESFSYVNQSVLYFSIPVPHALGDYAIIKFNLDGK